MEYFVAMAEVAMVEAEVEYPTAMAEAEVEYPAALDGPRPQRSVPAQGEDE